MDDIEFFIIHAVIIGIAVIIVSMFLTRKK
jgi:hypothetical protein